MSRQRKVVDDGLHCVYETSIVPGDDPVSAAAALAEILPGGNLGPFEFTVGGAEAYWRGIPISSNAKPLSKAWYARRILREISWLRRAVATPEGTTIDPKKIENLVVAALGLGALIEEAVWRFGFGDAARTGRKLVAARPKGGRTRGEQMTKAAARSDSVVAKYYRRWQMSDELQDDFRSAATYIHHKVPSLNRRTIERSLQRIQRSKSRQ